MPSAENRLCLFDVAVKEARLRWVTPFTRTVVNQFKFALNFSCLRLFFLVQLAESIQYVLACCEPHSDTLFSLISELILVLGENTFLDNLLLINFES